MAHRALARIHAGTGHHAQAIEHFREALFLDSGDADTTVELADALIASGDPLAAVEALQPLLRRAPELTHPACNWPWAARGLNWGSGRRRSPLCIAVWTPARPILPPYRP